MIFTKELCYILIFNSFIVAVTKSPCEQRNNLFSKEIEFGKRVCLSCQPGQYVSQFCTTNNTNWCTTCPNGYYVKYWNLCRICDECTKCPAELMLTVKMEILFIIVSKSK
ncbi:tumor necrosis factor receptor superfamily member 11B-like [Anneissia japonica]|uniref:tumor necrosis factor receptor superfamily member 11B-like n=1 Tax=Anneissia japonica TaxID=1529436 RepID=UPI0014258899|nr:tumor necrosis factor receptor superfamily member 11B-like [Anneissia japonica]